MANPLFFFFTPVKLCPRTKTDLRGCAVEKKLVKPRKRLVLKQELFDTLQCSSVAELSEVLGFQKSTLYGLLSGWRFPGADLQRTITEKLGISRDRLERLL